MTHVLAIPAVISTGLALGFALGWATDRRLRQIEDAWGALDAHIKAWDRAYVRRELTRLYEMGKKAA